MKKTLILTIVVLIILITIVIISNIIFNKNEGKYNNSYECCYDGMTEEEKNMINIQSPCPCSDDINIFEKTFIVLGIKRR